MFLFKNPAVCFVFVCYVSRSFVLCYLCWYVVLFVLLTTWLLTQHVNKQELN
jgi:hypothetical protein